ncbi:MAG: hypothetical protein JWO76_1780 [Nocardioides sp.]|nr:hypothetical protein [Nocardioides sp.]
MSAHKEIGWSLTLSGVFALVAALVAWQTGEDAGRAGHTHADATWVLAVAGLLLIVNGMVVLGLTKGGGWTPRDDPR